MVTEWGMSQRLGPVSYKMTEEDPFLGREMHQSRQFSEHTMEVIDEEVTKILQAAAVTALELLDRRRADLDRLAGELVKREELDRRDIRELIGASVHDNAGSDKDASAEKVVATAG
jgi:cell division protease FtsH